MLIPSQKRVGPFHAISAIGSESRKVNRMKGHLRFSQSTDTQFVVRLKKKTTQIPLARRVQSKGIFYGRRIPNRG
jgi:hypothetical protein